MTRPVYVLGIATSNHDRAACLMADGRVVGAVAEERLDRRKGSEGFYGRSGRGIVIPPLRAITRLLSDEGITLDQVDLVVCGRSITTCRDQLLDHLPIDPDRLVEPPMPSHHLAHAYSAYATCGFAEPAVLVIDEQGHWDAAGRFERCTWFTTAGGRLYAERRFYGTQTSLSLGMFYNVFAALCGLAEAGRPAAGKLMSLASTGRPHPGWPRLLHLGEDADAGCDLAELEDFLSLAGVPVDPRFADLRVRHLDELLIKYRPIGWKTPLAADLAAHAQTELQAAIVHTAARLKDHTGASQLAYAGGVALNCATNAHLSEAGWQDVHVHPAATDDGTALGLAAYGWIEVLGRPRPAMCRFRPFLGPRHPGSARHEALAAYRLQGYAVPHADVEAAADLLAGGAIVCWFTGRSEWGPRALGARSICANPLTPAVTMRLNATIKHREPFRPFGISLTADAADKLLDRTGAPPGLEPYMLTIATPRHESLHAVAHVDSSLRYQLVDEDDQPAWHELLRAVGTRTGLPALVNTSFNVFGEPLVESPRDAVRQFLLSGADALWLDGLLLKAADVPPPQWAQARAAAWADSGLDPLTAAIGLHAAGHGDAARALLSDHQLDPAEVQRRGAAAMRALHTLQQHLDTGGDVDHARQVLHWWQPDPDLRQALAQLAAAGQLDAAALAVTLLDTTGAPPAGRP